jgi:hypothetical protein
VDPIPRHLERVVGLLAEQRVIPPPPTVTLAFRDLLAGGVEVSGETFREPDVRDELEGPAGADRYLQAVADLSQGAVNILAVGAPGIIAALWGRAVQPRSRFRSVR